MDVTDIKSVDARPEHSTRGWKPARFRSILDNLKDVVYQTDGIGRWTFLNRAWEQITGFSVEQSLGKSCLDFIHPEERDGLAARFRSMLEVSNGLATGEVRYLTRDGGVRRFLVQARAEHAGDGVLLGTSGLMTDITGHRGAEDELRETRQRLEFVSASSPAVLYAGRPAPHYTTTFVTANVVTMFGYEPVEFTSRPGLWLELVHPDDRAAAQRALGEMELRGEASCCSRMRHRNGDYRKVRWAVRLVRDAAGAPLEVLGCAVDETGLRDAEEALDRYGAIHQTIAYAAHRFLDSGSWESVIVQVLESLGKVTGASRIRLVQDCGEGGGPEYEWSWTAPGLHLAPREPGPSILPGLEWDSRIGRKLQAMEPFCGPPRDLPEPVRSTLERDGIRSLILVPIPVGRKVWGVLGLEDCLHERPWPAAETGAMRSVAGMLGAAMHREQNERALRYREALLRTAANVAPLGVLVVDPRADLVLFSNDRFCTVLGVTHLREQLQQGKLTSGELIAACQSMALDASAFADAGTPFEEDASYLVIQDQIPLRDGRTLRRFVTQIRDDQGQYFGRMYLFEDVTAQRRAERALQRAHDELETRVAERTAELQQLNSSLRVEIAERHRAEVLLAERESNFRALIENTLDVIAVVDRGGVVRYVSPSVRRVFEYAPEELVGRAGVELVHPQDREEVLPQYRKLVAASGTRPPLVCRVRHKDETWRVVEVVSNNQVANPAVRGVVLTVRDITERRRLEEQFRQAQKLEAIGRLAGGVAHDFNNLLTVIRGYSGLVAKRMGNGNAALRDVGQIQRAADRAAELVQQLLAFSRKQIVEPKVLDMHATLAELESVLRRLIGDDIELTMVPGSDPLYVRIDPGQFEQMVMNLTVNARDAMPRGGTLTIEAGTRTAESGHNCRTCKVSSGTWAVLAMRDTGVGISEDALPHIFEPFFTTKEVGKGTGLGLSMIYGAIEQAGGHVCVESTLGEGSTFRICLPIAEEGALPLA